MTIHKTFLGHEHMIPDALGIRDLPLSIGDSGTNLLLHGSSATGLLERTGGVAGGAPV
ncbi:hypothetical protein [Sorangium sp. So ce426]|uniref:hypothetical protein n=1 Tax=Sorangium sp. So ce426 TaxID=3133312 RepID=UPI003F5BDFE4